MAQNRLADLGVVDPDKKHGRKHLIRPPGYGSVEVAFRPAASLVNATGKASEDAPRVTEQVPGFKAVTLTEGTRGVFAEAAHVLRFPKAYDAAPSLAPIAARTCGAPST